MRSYLQPTVSSEGEFENSVSRFSSVFELMKLFMRLSSFLELVLKSFCNLTLSLLKATLTSLTKEAIILHAKHWNWIKVFLFETNNVLMCDEDFENSDVWHAALITDFKLFVAFPIRRWQASLCQRQKSVCQNFCWLVKENPDKQHVEKKNTFNLVKS